MVAGQQFAEGRLFTRGVQDNMDRAALSRLVPGLLRMGELFSVHRKLQPGDSLPHDDHFHLRVACSPEEAQAGCSGGGPTALAAARRFHKNVSTPHSSFCRPYMN